MPDIEEVWQEVNLNGLFPDELNLDPEFVRKLAVNNKISRTLGLILLLTDKGTTVAQGTEAGIMKVADTGAGFEQYITESGTAADTYIAANQYQYADIHSRWDILIETNDALVSFRNPENTAWSDDIVMPKGIFSIDLATQGFQVKNRVAASNTDYYVTAYR